MILESINVLNAGTSLRVCISASSGLGSLLHALRVWIDKAGISVQR